MKKSLNILGVLIILLFQFTSCLKNEDNGKPFYYFYDEPAAVIQTGDYPLIRNQSDEFYVPGLAGDTLLKEGDLLWTSFIVDLDNEKELPPIFSKFYYTAKYFKYQIVDSARAILPADTAAFRSYLSDDYSAPIESSVLYNYTIYSLWFFGFQQDGRSNQVRYTYELILNPEIEKTGNSYPTLYIRSKPINTSPGNLKPAYSRDGNMIFAFDAAGFVDYYRKAISPTGPVRFNLKYKNGVDSNGNDIYRAFMSNPISWRFGVGKSD